MDLDSFKLSLKENIKGVLPHLDSFLTDTLVDNLIFKGVKKLPDLRHITVNVLQQFDLDFIDSSELYEEWQSKYGVRPNSSAGPSNEIVNQPSTSRAPLAPLQQNAQAVISGLPVFDCDSPYMPVGVKTAIRNKVRPSSSDREDMVNRIVDRCREVIPNLTRKTFVAIGIDLVSMYPDSFKDTIQISEHGADSLIFQFKTKYDNDRRPEPCADQYEKERAAPAVKEAVGCINWNPALPDDESEDSQAKTSQELRKMHKISPKNWEWNLIKRKLTASYYLQRKDINGKLANVATNKRQSRKRKRKQSATSDEEDGDDSISDLTIVQIREKWPFLFTAKGVEIHFQLLTGKDFPALVTNYMTNSGLNIIEYLAGTSEALLTMKRASRLAESQGYGAVTLSTALLMLLKYFKEERKYFIIFVERTTQLAEATARVESPEPILVCAGLNIFDYDKIYFVCDKTVLCSASNVLEGLTLLFTSYFVFNYLYPNELSCLLTFIQKAILEINPVKNSRCKDAKIAAAANKKVMTFYNKFTVYDQNARAASNLNDM